MKNEADKEELVFLLLPAPIAEEASTLSFVVVVTQTVDEGCDGFCRMLSKVLSLLPFRWYYPETRLRIGWVC